MQKVIFLNYKVIAKANEKSLNALKSIKGYEVKKAFLDVTSFPSGTVRIFGVVLEFSECTIRLCGDLLGIKQDNYQDEFSYIEASFNNDCIAECRELPIPENAKIHAISIVQDRVCTQFEGNVFDMTADIAVRIGFEDFDLLIEVEDNLATSLIVRLEKSPEATNMADYWIMKADGFDFSERIEYEV